DAFASTKPVSGGSWAAATKLSDVTSNADYEQFDGRQVPFAGDYLWISSQAGLTFGAWTDWRDTVAGVDQRETTPDETGADVLQCRTQKPDGSFTGDTCPRPGGLDQNIYGDLSPCGHNPRGRPCGGSAAKPPARTRRPASRRSRRRPCSTRTCLSCRTCRSRRPVRRTASSRSPAQEGLGAASRPAG